MLKIKESVDLKELEKFGFKKKYYYKACVLESEDGKKDIIFDYKTRKYSFVIGVMIHYTT